MHYNNTNEINYIKLFNRKEDKLMIDRVEVNLDDHLKLSPLVSRFRLLEVLPIGLCFDVVAADPRLGLRCGDDGEDPKQGIATVVRTTKSLYIFTDDEIVCVRPGDLVQIYLDQGNPNCYSAANELFKTLLEELQGTGLIAWSDQAV